jgi:xanthine dehydrogenase accessory factor
MKADILERLLRARADKRPVALVTDLKSGLQSLVEGSAAHGGFGLDEALIEIVRRQMRDDRSGIVEHGDAKLFIHVFNPPLRLIIVGAVHIAQPLAPMAALAGYDVTVVDPRRAFASDERFPGVAVRTDWPDDAFAELKPDTRTAVVTLTHDPKIDDPALVAALRSEAFYIGALGSKRTHARRVERLKEEGFGPVEIGRIHGPVGLSIGAVSPAEIAISILAQVTDVLHAARRTEAKAA